MSDYVLIGNPIIHSLSPLIHNKLFNKKGYSLHYGLLDTQGNFLHAINEIEHLQLNGTGRKIQGFNVTIPFKEQIIPKLHHMTLRARASGAVNTVKITPEGWIGDNTDGAGFVQGILSRDFSLKKSHVAIIGAGGAARGIAYALSVSGVCAITICARRPEQAHQLIADITPFSPAHVKWRIQGLSVPLESIDILVNTLPGNAEVFIFETLLGNLKDGLAADIVYRPRQTPFILNAIDRGLSVSYGLDMLFYQAVLAQEFWLGNSDLDLLQLREEVYVETAEL